MAPADEPADADAPPPDPEAAAAAKEAAAEASASAKERGAELLGKIYAQIDVNKSGSISASELKAALGAHSAELTLDWLDASGDGALTKREFTVAIYLTERARDGRRPPRSLPPGPFPPAARQQAQPQQIQPQTQPRMRLAASAPFARDAFGALDENLFSGGPDPGPSGRGEAFAFGGAGGNAATGANAIDFGAAPAAPAPPSTP